MKTSAKIGALLAAVLVATAGASMAAPVNPYVTSSTGNVVQDPYGLCWRTGFWTPALAEKAGPNGLGCTCDKDLLSAGACQQAVKAAAPAAAPKASKVTLSADTLFAFDRAVLTKDGKAMLDDLVNRMAGIDLEVVLTTGYADRIGKPAYNQKLSERRAEAVKTYLVSKGVDADRVQTEGRGTADPVVNCPNPSKKGEVKNLQQLIKCLAPNRRTVIEVVGTRTTK